MSEKDVNPDDIDSADPWAPARPGAETRNRPQGRVEPIIPPSGDPIDSNPSQTDLSILTSSTADILGVNKAIEKDESTSVDYSLVDNFPDMGDEEEWNTIAWQVDFPVDENGKRLRGKEVLNNNPIFRLNWQEGDDAKSAAFLLTPQLAANFKKAFTEAADSYQEPVAVKVQASERWNNVVSWHKSHKFLGPVSLLFTASFVFGMVYSFIISF